MKYCIIIGILILIIGCAKTPVIYKTSCKAEPKLLNIKVNNGCICGKALDDLIKNHIDIYEYVEYLKSVGCK